MSPRRLLSEAKSKYTSLPKQVRASLWFLICNFSQRGITVISTPIFTRILDASEYGQFSVFNSWLSIVHVFVTLNLSYGVYTQGLVKFSERRDEYSSSLQGLVLLLVSCWTAGYLLMPGFWNGVTGLTSVQMLAMLCMCWSATVFQFWSADQRVDFNYRKLVAITIATSLAKPIVGILLVLNADDKVTARILGLAAVELIAYTWMFFYHLRKGRKLYDKAFWWYALAFNIPLIPHYLSQVVLSGSDRIMIASMQGDYQAGLYSLAYSVSQVMTLFNQALVQTIEPWLYKRLHAGSTQGMARVCYSAFCLIACVNLLLMALAPEIVALFAPAEYGAAVWVIPPVSMSVYFMFAYVFFAVFEFYYEKTRLVSIATIVGAVANLLLNWLLIPRLGFVAAGYTTLTCYVIYAVMHYVFMNRLSTEHFGSNPYSLKVLLLITIAFVGSGLVLLATYALPVLRFGIIVATVVTAFVFRRKILNAVKGLVSLREASSQ